MRVVAMCLAVAACAQPTPPEPAVTQLDHREVAPLGLPDDAPSQVAHNNLDVTVHQGRVWLAYRTAPTHFASRDTVMGVVSSADEVTWRFEGQIAIGTDVREPQLVSADGELWLHYAELGTSPVDFEPSGAWRVRFEGDGAWSEPETFGPEGFIPWRIKPLDGRWTMTGYVGGENVYDAGGQPIRIHWYAGDDGVTWAPAVGDDPVVLEGGGSESDLVLLDDGSLVAVVRNEAGDDDGFGSKVCTAPAGDLGTWTCDADPRKYDSPLVLQAAGRVWLIARRNVTDDGHYDLGRDDLPPGDQYISYQAAYWGQPKRCSVWLVDPATRSVSWMADLPSKGDTCFPEALPTDDPDVWTVYNYTSDPDGEDLSWLQGQQGPTIITRTTLRFE